MRNFSVSTHAPLAGCDRLAYVRDVVAYGGFNSRAPRGVRRLAFFLDPENWEFQLTRPSRGATQIIQQFFSNYDVSTHAPLAGCDSDAVKSFAPSSVFQLTRPSRGATHLDLLISSQSYGFNSRAPRGVRLGEMFKITYNLRFNSRAPRGVRPSFPKYLTDTGTFQLTRPSRGATYCGIIRSFNICVSTHAPLAGCDELADLLLSPEKKFQLTRPSRGATDAELSMYSTVLVSTHAPLAGCDMPHPQNLRRVASFNSRAPRGVRLQSLEVSRAVFRFNSRAPRGVRLISTSSYPLNPMVSTHAPLAGCDQAKL